MYEKTWKQVVTLYFDPWPSHFFEDQKSIYSNRLLVHSPCKFLMNLPATILHATECMREREQQQRAEAAEDKEQRLKQGTVFAAVLECSNLYSLLLIVAIGIAHALLATQCTRLTPQCCAFVCWYVHIVTYRPIRHFISGEGERNRIILVYSLCTSARIWARPIRSQNAIITQSNV